MEPQDQEWGILGRDGRWTGTVGELERQRADFSLILSPVPERTIVIDFSRIYNNDPLVIVSLRPQLLPQHLAFARPFTGNDPRIYMTLGGQCSFLVQEPYLRSFSRVLQNFHIVMKV